MSGDERGRIVSRWENETAGPPTGVEVDLAALVRTAEGRGAPEPWFGLIVEAADGGRRRYRHVSERLWPTWEAIGRVVDRELAALGGGRVVALQRCTYLDHADGVMTCRFALWERA